MAKLVTIFGGSGFVGRHIARRMAKAGWRVRVAVRRPNEAIFVKPYGAVGQVVPIMANVRDDESVRRAMHGADAVVSCVSVPVQHGKQTFNLIQHHGTARIGRIAAEEGIGRVVHISAIGADANSRSLYAETKAQGEAALLEAVPGAMILRPSIMFGPGDGFFNMFGSMARVSPVIPIFGANSKFQPVYVDDVAAAAVKGVTGEAQGGIYELGGPEIMTFRELIQLVLQITQRRRLILPLPYWVGSAMGGALNIAQMLTFGLFKNRIITPDQVILLREDNVANPDMPGLKDLGIEPVSMDAVLEDYLWPYRPSGQYAEIKDSARGLKVQE
ncbi:NAD(P)H-binding protein [Rhodobacterales bacterium HKCCE3408]|nr:NAD(P)H-binding protein [Rhodobacterales bacterium HKCCE3408]